ncbi:hypothetical protein ACWD4G_12835 [Streptomyces sp. NPDC002643]
MGTKTADETGAGTGADATKGEETVNVTKEDTTADTATEAAEEVQEVGEASGAAEGGEGADDIGGPDALDEDGLPVAAKSSPGVGQGAAAIVSVVLALVSLTGSWVGNVAQARNQMFGQLETAQNADVATMLHQYYGESWNANALVAGIFALVGLLVGVFVLMRPAFGDPDQVQAPWVKSAAWAGITVAFIGLILAVLKYTDILLSVPST